MRESAIILVESLGQSGFRFELGSLCVYIDPYLSDRVEQLYGEDMRRLVAPLYRPQEAPRADWVLISHVHEDHCDPDTLLPLCAASADLRVICTASVARYLMTLGIASKCLVNAEESWISLDHDTKVFTVPAAHPKLEREADGRLRSVGYVIEYRGRRIYHSGDTSPHAAIFKALAALAPLEVAFLPVNEANYYRELRGIVGNMSVREAFQMAGDLGVDTLVPMHWDLFRPNSVFREELLLLYDLLRPPFRLMLNPSEI